MTRVCVRLHNGEVFTDRLVAKHEKHIDLAARGRVGRDRIAAFATYTPKKRGD